MSVKIEDISKRLNISVSTVSKALNGYSDVSDVTRDLVLETAQSMGYHPSAAARNLRRGRTDKIGLLINNSIQFISEYLGEVISGLALEAEKEGHNIVLYTAVSSHQDVKRICRNREVDGLIVVWSDVRDGTIELIHEENIPFVVFGRRVDDQRISYVSPDNYRGALDLTRHLIEEGHTRIAFTTRSELGITNEDRFAGYCDGLKESGIPIEKDLIINTKIEPHSGYQAMQALLAHPRPPTALFAIHDLLAADALRAAQDAGLSIPDDIAIAGFDGLGPSLTSRPAITTVRQPLREMAQKAMTILFHSIEEKPLLPDRTTYPVTLIPRRSTRTK
ncbi:MAG: LacI family DNA-binding transcriptional regulator [Chloroflexota bacterium]